jgi:hypothetical protein
MREERRGKREEGRKNWEHLKFVKKTVVGASRSLLDP